VVTPHADAAPGSAAGVVWNPTMGHLAIARRRPLRLGPT
jgi:hypothetical protein